jgi:energy-coupling factor transporter ATP-binding protein EcfA2
MSIKIKDLSFIYPDSKKKALKNINLNIDDGEFCCILGKNLAGKSTLCYTITGFIPHFFKGKMEGKVLIDDLDTNNLPLHKIVTKVGFVMQNPFNQLSGSKFTVFEELAFSLENLGIFRNEMIKRVEEILKKLKIYNLRHRSPYELSGGQQQMVAIASILVMKPKILVLDEPTSQLDPVNSKLIFSLIEELNNDGVTIVIAEHKIDEIFEFSDRILLIEDGEIIIDDFPNEIFKSFSKYKKYVKHMKLPCFVKLAKRMEREDLWKKYNSYPINFKQAKKEFSKRPKI